MNKEKFEEVSKRLQEVSKVISNLDPSIKEEGFSILKDYILEGNKNNIAPPLNNISINSLADFFKKFNPKTPAEKFKIVVAYHFSEFGDSEFSLKEIRKLSKQVGYTLPERLDMTIKGSKHKGKGLFTSTSRGKYRPTTNGEIYFTDVMKITKGTKSRLEEKES